MSKTQDLSSNLNVIKNSYFKTPEKTNFFEKRSYSETIKNEQQEKNNENDDLVNINEDSSLENSNMKNFICENHEEEMSLFCVNDKETLCQSCAYFLDKHKNHKIVPIKYAFDIITKDNEKFRMRSKEKIVKIDDFIKISMKNIALINNNLICLVSDIEKEFGNLHKILEEKEKEILMSLNQICSMKIQNYENKIKDMTYLRNCLNDYKSIDFTSQFDHNTFVYIYNVNSLLKKTLDNIDLNVRMLNLSDLEKLDFSNKKKILKELETFSNICSKNEKINQIKKTNINTSMLIDLNYTSLEERNKDIESLLESEKNNVFQSNRNSSKNQFHRRSKTDFIGKQI